MNTLAKNTVYPPSGQLARTTYRACKPGLDWGLRWLVLAMLIGWGASAHAVTANITIVDSASNHVHSIGSYFTLQVSVDQPGIRCQWRDYSTNVLSAWTNLPSSGSTTITSPTNTWGYYELVFNSTNPSVLLPNRTNSEDRPYGFVIFPAVTRTNNTAARMGMNKPYVAPYPSDVGIDPYLGGWIKTLTWTSTGSNWWSIEILRRRNAGLEELPLVEGAYWDSDWNGSSWVSVDDTKVITNSRLNNLKAKFQGLVHAEPSVKYWELGREENLGSRYTQAHYWDNLNSKAQACRDAVTAEGAANVNFIYQIVDHNNTNHIQQFLTNSASSRFQILSLHPYAWNNYPATDYPDPELWLGKFIDDTHTTLANNGRATMPIWFTEMGAPVQDNYPGGPFGYSPYTSHDNGVSRGKLPIFMAKVETLSLSKGVDKIFWYEAKDEGADRAYAEDNFGNLDYLGYPKPSYATYFALQYHLADNDPDPINPSHSIGSVQAYDFVGQDKTDPHVQVAWTYNPANPTNVALFSLRPGMVASNIISVKDTVGAALPVPTGTGLNVNDKPIFLTEIPFTDYEVESLLVTNTVGSTHSLVDTNLSNGGGTQLDSTATGNYITYVVPNVSAGTYQVIVGVKKWNSRGIFQLSIGRADSFDTSKSDVGTQQDLYTADPAFTEVNVGTWIPGTSSDKWFRFTVVGKNSSSTNYYLAFDYIKLIPH